MSTGTKKNSLIPTLVVIGLVLAGLSALKGFPINKPTTDRYAPRKVVVSAIWNPSPRPEGVAMRITVGGVSKEDAVATVAPVTRSYLVERGTRVEIYVRLQGEHRAELGCSIMVDGTTMITEHKDKAGPTDPLACWLVV